MLVPVDLQHVRMLAVIPRQRANAVRRQELLSRRACSAARAAGDRPPTTDSSRRSPRPGVRMQATLSVRSWPVLDEPLEPPLEVGQPLEHVRLERLDREQRDQPDHRSHLQREPRAVRQPQRVVEEAVLVVPEIEVLALALMAHRVADVEEVLPELARDVFVGRILARQLHRHRQQVERVHAPSSSCRRTARDGRRSAAAPSDRRRRCCRGRGSRPGRRCCLRRPCGSPTR